MVIVKLERVAGREFLLAHRTLISGAGFRVRGWRGRGG
jgi:hypothetical protein